MEKKIIDLAVLGAGPGGYVAAIRAAKLGLKTILIEKGHLGGVCLNTGCIPTKALHFVSQNIDELKKSNIFGINITGFNIDFQKVMERKDWVINAQRKGIQYHLSRNKVELISGNGKLTDTNKILVNKEFQSSGVTLNQGKVSFSASSLVNGAGLCYTGINIKAGKSAPAIAYSSNLTDAQCQAFMGDCINMFYGTMNELFLESVK